MQAKNWCFYETRMKQPSTVNLQTFLKTIYSIFENDKFTHDEFFENLPYPIKRENGRFIGERINIDESPFNQDWKLV